MWGEWIDIENGVSRGGGPDDPSDRWYLFEDDESSEGPGPFRSMQNPHEFDDPERLYEQGYWYYGQDQMIFVHTNSGVGNKLCYLLTDGSIGEPGGQFNGHTIWGMGFERTADLFYECQIGMIPQACDYYDLYHVITQAAKTLGMTWEERVNIEEACQAVEIANDPLVHWWKFDETSGTTAHDSVSNKDGTLTNMDPLTDWVAGKIDGALDFDGTDDHVALDAIDALKSGAVTVSAWIKTYDVVRTYSPILTQWHLDGGNHGYYLCLNYGKPTFYLDDFEAQSSYSIGQNEWHHLAGTYNSKVLKIYVDGVLKGSNPDPYLKDKKGAADPAFIGFDGDTINGYGHFQGIIDDVRVYRWGVDVDEILDKMFYGTSKFCVKNGSGVRVAWFDDLGNLFLKGTKQTVWQEPSDQTDEFIVKRSDGVPMAYINDSGNLFLQGTFSEGQTPVPSDADEFRVQDSTGADVAIIDTTNGSITIKGKLYQQNP
jgi:hypothetical protein